MNREVSWKSADRKLARLGEEFQGSSEMGKWAQASGSCRLRLEHLPQKPGNGLGNFGG